MRRPGLAAHVGAALLCAAPAMAQHAHQEEPSPRAAASPSPMAMPEPSPAAVLFDSDMSRMTGMTPVDPMGGMAMPGWTPMFMGIVRLHYNHQGGPSGDDAVESSNWSMVMAQHDLGRGRLTLMMMNSLEPATFPEGGTPELFQTGEALQGKPLVDRQHPHDFFMNLSATYRMSIGGGAAWIQLAPVGEPALGPVAFMHRASAGENPAAPLGHHWLDSSHITSNVITLGGGLGRVGLEVSAFHGREPDEHRWNLDGGALDSASARVKLALGRGWSAQASYGFLHDAEQLSPGDVRRTTASIHYGAKGDRPLAVSLLWGRDREEHGVSDAFLVEAAWQLDARDQVFTRAERVEKDLALLATKGLDPAAEHGTASEETVPVRALTVGYLRTLASRGSLSAGLGADLTFYAVHEDLRAAYGDALVSTHVFARLRWGRPHGAHHTHGSEAAHGDPAHGHRP